MFSGESLGVKLQFTNHIFFRTAVLRKLFDIRFSYKHCNFSRVCLLVKMASKTVTRSIALAFSLCVSVPASSLLFFHYYRFFSIALLSLFLWQTLLQFFRHEDFFICCCLMTDVFLLLCCYGLSRSHFNLFVFPASKVLLFLCSLMADVIHCIFITFYTTEKKIYIFICSLARETYQSVCCLKANVFIALFLFFLYNSISLFFCRHLVSYLFVPYDWSLSYYFYFFQ